MNHLILVLIKLYWKIIPEHERGNCIFRKTCSHYIYDESKNKGFIQGVKAMIFRYRNCRRGFSLLQNPITGRTNMLLPGDNIIEEDDIAEYLVISQKKNLQNFSELSQMK